MMNRDSVPERIWATPSDEYCTATDIKSATRDALGFREYVLSTHCDELVAAARAEGAREAQAKIARMTEALTPSGDTKAAYMSEFEFIVFGMNDDGEECSHKITVPWTAIKEIMAAIKARAALQENANG